jgi:release factor glutamine methyltransferase
VTAGPAPTIHALLREACVRLAASPSARLDAELLLGAACELDRTALYRDSGRAIPAAAADRYQRLVDARRDGIPVSYLTGRKEFWCFDLTVTADVLIPRPETELLVEAALALLPRERSVRILELGVGSGAVAMALAHERPHARIDAVDCCPAALHVAAGNIDRYRISNIDLHQSDWFAHLPPMHYDLIVSNPPYVAADDGALRDGPTRFEPRLALDGGADGLDAIRRIVSQAPHYLAAAGAIALEHGTDQAAAVHGIARQHGFRTVTTLGDLQQHDRVTTALI